MRFNITRCSLFSEQISARRLAASSLRGKRRRDKRSGKLCKNTSTGARERELRAAHVRLRGQREGSSKLVAFGIKRENKLLGQGDAAEHQFHAWAHGRETRQVVHSSTRWKLPVALPGRKPGGLHEPRLGTTSISSSASGALKTELSSWSSWPLWNGWDLHLHKRRGDNYARGDFPDSISRECSRFALSTL